MATVDEANYPGMTGGSETDASTATNASPVQDTSSHDEASGCEARSTIPSNTSYESKDKYVAEKVHGVKESDEAVKSDHIKNDVLRSPFPSPKVSEESDEVISVSDEELPSVDGLSGGHSNGVVLNVDQDPVKEESEKDPGTRICYVQKC